jgi:hypothetical protein
LDQGTSDTFDPGQGARPLSGEVASLLGVLAEYLRRYANPVTREQNRQRLDDLFRSSRRTDPATVTEGDLVEWITAVPANNSVRGRLSTARTFFRWCLRAGVVTRDPMIDLDGLTKQYPKTYGKVQGAHPARWLTGFRQVAPDSTRRTVLTRSIERSNEATAAMPDRSAQATR